MDWVTSVVNSKTDTARAAVLRTLAYSAVFGAVPSFTQVRRLLVSATEFPEGKIAAAYRHWIQELSLHVTPLPRQRKREIAQELHRLQRIFKWIPWVEAAWITGSVAAEHLHGDDDIDLLVLTAPQRLWLTRLILVVYSVAMGKYRPRIVTSNQKVKDRWCWNLWLEPERLGDYGTASLYVARELVQAKMIFRRPSVATNVLLDAAPWISHYCFTAWKNQRAVSLLVGIGPQHSDPWLLRPLLRLLNQWAYRLQRWYMVPHQTWERVYYDAAWFHPRALAEKVQQRYETILSDWKSMQQSHDFIWPDDWTESEREVLSAISDFCARARSQGKRVILATGVFDLFHSEHQAFLTAAAREGDELIVGIESDVRTRQLKGEGRPRQSQSERKHQVESFAGVSKAFVLPDSFSAPLHHRSIIALLRPDVLAVSSHSPHQDKKAALLNEYGGELKVVHDHNPLVSTTQLLSVQ